MMFRTGRGRLGRRGGRGSRGVGRAGRGGGGGPITFWRYRSAQSFLICFATDAVGLLLLDARGVALDSDPKLDAEIKGFLVREAELSS
jgi:hypothetical protein